jgi:hypothetical protein
MKFPFIPDIWKKIEKISEEHISVNVYRPHR